MKSHELKAAKRHVRHRVIAARDALTPAARAAQASAATDRLLSLREVHDARVVMAFWSFGSEISTTELLARLQEAGTVVVLPVIRDRDLEPRTFRPGDPLTEAPFGAMEPSGGELAAPGAIDVVVVPAVAYDRTGRRIGYGGGFYDRFLRATPALRVGFGFDEQLVDEDLPAGGFDLPVSIVVTPSEVVRC
jgi:5-formyltetrahydrofolate cyclo-ligase